MSKVYDMVVIGGGPAGYTAALYAARAGRSVAVVERMAVGGQMTLTGDIDNYPGFPDGVDGFTLGMKMQQGAERFGAETVYADVTAVELEGAVKTVHTADGALKARAVIVATGANPRRLGLQNEEALTGEGVHYCAHCDGRFYQGRHVAVIGGGNSAASDALYLSGLARQVTLVHRRDSLRATKLYHQPLMSRDNVSFLWNSTVAELLTEDGRFQGLTVCDSDGKRQTLLCDAVFVSIGREPATAFLKDAVPTDAAGYVIADETTCTPIDGVFAAGDVRQKLLRQVVTAVSDGAVAAQAAEDWLNRTE